ncbi:MAG: lytic transglycosylase domain-containing protein [Burkholderiales bacterium]
MTTRCRFFGLVLFALASAPCLADIFGYVDEEGRAHFSDVRLDERYTLFIRETPRVEEVVLAPPPAEAQLEIIRTSVAGMPLSQARKNYASMISRVAREQKVDAALLHAVVTVESGYNPRAKSPRGATGLMQLMPDTARQYGVNNILDPLENLRGGARYLRALLSMFDNNVKLAIAAYNAGEGAVMRAGRAIPNFPETRAYVPRVLKFYEQYRGRTSS